jgi:hypothetical protein
VRLEPAAVADAVTSPVPVERAPGDTVPAPDRWTSRLRSSYLFWPAAVYLALRGLTLAALAVTDRFTHDSFGDQVYRWDGVWFVRAAVHGYPRHLPMAGAHVARSTIAFLPVFPGVVRWLSYATTVSPLVVAWVVSAATGLTATLAVGALVREWAGPGPATRAAVFFAVFPGTFVFDLMYSEGIAITCLALGLLALLRGRWWIAGVLGAVATGTTPIALAFVLSCAWCAAAAVRQDRAWRALVAPVLTPLGFLAYQGWLWVHTGQWNAWRLTERGGWQSYPSLVYPFHIVATFVFDPLRPTQTGQLLMAGTVFTVVAAVLAVRQRQPTPVLLYGLAAAALAAVAAPVGLRPRFIMLAFPLVAAIGTRLHGRAYGAAVAASVCALGGMVALEFFTHRVFP